MIYFKITGYDKEFFKKKYYIEGRVITLLRNIGRIAIREIKSAIDETETNASTTLRKSFVASVVKTFNKTTLDIYSTAPYADVANSGTRRRKSFPNVEELRRWVKLKHSRYGVFDITDKKEIDRIAYLVGRKMVKKGSKGTRYMDIAMSSINQIIKQEMSLLSRKS